MNNVLVQCPQVRAKTKAHVLVYEPDVSVPTLNWAPTCSIFCDGKGNVRHLWGLANRNDVVALCRVTNVRFIDQSSQPILSS